MAIPVGLGMPAAPPPVLAPRRKTRQLDVRTTASEEVEALRETWGKQVNQALERAGRDERVDHRSYARQGLGIEPTVKMGHASSAIERRAQRQRPEGREYRPVTVRGQFNELVREARQLGVYVERGREWLRSVGERVKALGSGLGMSDLVQGAAWAMRAELDTKGGGEGLVPAIGVEIPGRGRTPGTAQERQAQSTRDRERDDHDRGGRGR